jgi:hypothetical protein
MDTQHESTKKTKRQSRADDPAWTRSTFTLRLESKQRLKVLAALENKTMGDMLSDLLDTLPEPTL